jgi:hypothetical protein
MDEQSVSQFKGYLLELTMSSPKFPPDEQGNPFPMRPMSVMLLARHLPHFCNSMSRGDGFSPGFTLHVRLELNVAPVGTASLLGSLFMYGSS